MAMTDRQIRPETDDEMLDALLAEMRNQAVPAPSQSLMDRILADAEAEMPRPRAGTAIREPVPQGGSGGWLGGLLSGLGGWGGLGGLATATVAGVWIGFSGQVGGTSLTDYFGTASAGAVELFPLGDDILAAGTSEG